MTTLESEETCHSSLQTGPALSVVANLSEEELAAQFKYSAVVKTTIAQTSVVTHQPLVTSKFNVSAQMYRAVDHPIGTCASNAQSMCEQCVSLKRAARIVRKMPDHASAIFQNYFIVLSKMSTNAFTRRIIADHQCYENQIVTMKHEIRRAAHAVCNSLSQQQRGMIFGWLEPKREDYNRQQRTEKRDAKYAPMFAESDFETQALGPIEHQRGDCDESNSMCDDCASLHKAYVIGKWHRSRVVAAYALYWRIAGRVTSAQGRYMLKELKDHIPNMTLVGVYQAINSYFIHAPQLGVNGSTMTEMYDLLKLRQMKLEGFHERAPSNIYENIEEGDFKAQMLDFHVSPTVSIECPTIDKITDMLSRLIVNNNLGVNPADWARRLASFVLMIVQLCSESSLVNKMAAVAQFLTHFHLPGIGVFRGYAQQLAQVFQTAVERIRGARNGVDENFVHRLADDFEEDGPGELEGDFHTQIGDAPPEGILVGTAKLLCAMAGVTDYDVKANAQRVSKLDQISRTIMSTERLAHFVEKLFKYAYDMASLHVFGIHPDMRELAMVSTKIPVWMDKVSLYYNGDPPGVVRVTKDLDEARQVMQWAREGDEYNQLLWKFLSSNPHHTMPKAYTIFKGAHMMCMKLADAAAPYLADSSMRAAPFSLYLWGGPGLGKSVVQHFIITDIMKHSFALRGKVYKPGEQEHVRNSEAKHWDGYRGQAVIIIDDAFQSMDAESTITQCMDLIHCKNTIAWPVAKADLGSKGNTYMTSEFLMLTGNTPIPEDIKGVVRSFDAVRRRIDLMVELVVIPQYLDSMRRLDKRKIERDFPPTFIDGLPVAADITSVMRFNIQTNTGVTVYGATYDTLIKMAIEMKEHEKMRDESVIRRNYLRAGRDVHGNELPFETQMWRSPRPSTSATVDDYQGDLLFQSDLDQLATAMTKTPYHNQEWALRGMGFVSDEERLEIYCAAQSRMPAPESWTTKMKVLYKGLCDRLTSASTSFTSALGDFIDKTREHMTGHLMFKVGFMILTTISVVSLGVMIKNAFGDAKRELAYGADGITYRFIGPADEVKQPLYNKEGRELTPDELDRIRQTQYGTEGGTSGDEKTRKTQTKFIVEDGPLHRKSEIAVKHMPGCTAGTVWRAVKSTPERTHWVPESQLGSRRPLMVHELLWDEKDKSGRTLPHDVLEKTKDGLLAQSCSDLNAYNLGINKITNNAVVIEAFDGERSIGNIRGLFIYGRVLMVPLHLFHGLSVSSTPLELVSAVGIKTKVNTSECDVKSFGDRDVIFLRLPKRFACHVDIRSHFHSSATVNRYPMDEAMLWVIDGENNGKIITLCNNIKKDSILDYKVAGSKANNTRTEERIHVVKSYVYNGLALSGYCGSPLVWLNPSVQGGHILGIHVAGTQLRGLSTPITREFLYEALKDWDDISITVPTLDPDDGDMTTQSKRAIGKTSGLPHFGRVSQKMQVRLPTHTNIIRSPLYGVFEPTTAPALLSPVGEINPLRNGIMKQKVPLVVFEQEHVDAAVAHLMNDIMSYDSPYKNTERPVLTAREALNGFPGDKWTPPMNLHTSPGYPYIHSNTSKNGKFDFVSGESGERELHQIVAEKLEKRLSEARDRKITMTLFMDILKDERVKLEKVRIGKTRVFNVAPFDLNIAVRMYFQKFASHIMFDHVFGECAVGLNPHSDEWGMMYHHLKHMGQNWIGGDYSNYDKQLSYQLLRGVLKIIDAFYDDGNENVRECLFETMFSAFHIAERDVYRVYQGNPSGIVMTSIINSLVNSLMMRIMYIDLGGSLTTFSDNVRLKTYGDDNIASVSEEVKWFNMESISRSFAKYGIVYNRPDKEEIQGGTLFLKDRELTFLKREFREDTGRVLAPLSMASIKEMVNWIRESNDDVEATRANFTAACREMFHHGREAFDEFTTHVYAVAQKRSLRLPYVDYLTSGQYWGTESGGRVILPISETVHRERYCCDLDNEEEIFISQSLRAPHKIKAVQHPGQDSLFYTQANQTASETTEPMDNTASSTTNADNITSRNQITTFSDTSILTQTTPQDVAPIPLIPVDPYMKESLTAFIGRTYYATYTWTPAMAMGTLIAQVSFPNFLLSVIPIWDKVKNFAYFRAGVKIGIRMNGSKFHYGQMLVSWSPQFNNTLDLVNATNNIFSASGCPCFTISPSENEVHEFELPYALPYNYIPLYNESAAINPAYQFGVVNMYVLNPLSNASTPTPVSFTLFANFVDVDVAGYSAVGYTIPTRITNTQATTPAILPATPARPTSVVGPDPLPPAPITPPPTTDEEVFFAQRASKEQSAKSEKGIIGTVLESVSAISGALTFIPEIGIVAAGISAATGGAAMVANYFGWTNPVSLRAIQPVTIKFANLVNTHGLNDGTNLTIKPDAAVAPACNLLGGNGHEMEMLHIAQTPSLLIAGATWSPSDATDSTLIYQRVGPAQLNQDTGGVWFPNLLQYVTNTCQYWRGSIRYHLQVVCSQMHVGRLRISYDPYIYLGALTSDQLASTTSFILDIEQQSSISFTIPYLFHQPWSFTSYTTTGITGYQPGSIGTIRISVVNVLNHPATPVPGVFMNLWVSAGPDFQLARPTNDNLFTNWYLQASDEDTEETAFETQGLTRDDIRSMPAPPLVPATGSRENNICHADEVHHIKDLVMRPQNIGYLPDTMTTSALAFSINPWLPVVRQPGTAANYVDMYSYMRCIYRYSRGGIRVSFQNNSSQTPGNQYYSLMSNFAWLMPNTLTLTGYLSATSAASIITNSLFQYNDGCQYSNSPLMPQSVVMPWYANVYGITNAGRYAATSANYWLVSAWTFVNNLYVTYLGGGAVTMAAADDYELVYLVGPPAINATNT